LAVYEKILFLRLSELQCRMLVRPTGLAALDSWLVGHEALRHLHCLRRALITQDEAFDRGCPVSPSWPRDLRGGDYATIEGWNS